MILALIFSSTVGLARDYTTPTKALSAAEFPHFSDDLELNDMQTAIVRQLQRYDHRDLSGTIRYGTHSYPLSRMPQTLRAFSQLIQTYQSCREGDAAPATCDADLNAAVAANFDIYAPDLQAGDPRYGQDKDSFFTGYETHTIMGSRTPTAELSRPIYALPAQNADRQRSRQEIDFHGALSGRASEIGYGGNLFDLYLLHIEGSGYVQLADQTGYYLSYAGENGQKWNWISKYMLAQGYIDNGTIAAQRKFLRQHPELEEQIYSTCPSYVYFKTSAIPPAGSDDVSLTDGRSIATDRSLYAFKGGLAYIVSERPLEDGNYDLEQEDQSKIPFQAFSRFFLDQDTGGAIKGKGRADIYFGIGEYATYAASYQQQLGNLYFLMLKDAAAAAGM